MRKQSVKNSDITALYPRLSRDDDVQGESNSIANQKKLLAKYAKDNKFGNTKFYIDDGYTGTNFNRPGFKDMIDDIEAGYVKTVIVKDMSRFGRDYVQVGYYTETYFAEHDVRFIAINNNVDTAKEDSSDDLIIPIRNVMNEYYSRDISRKVRSAHKIRGEAGEPLSQAPYGYKKDPDNKKRWIIDEEAAENIRKIYQLCIDGKGVEQTARIMQESKILKPTAYWQSKGVRKPGKKSAKDQYYWSKGTIAKILNMREYVGDVVNFKTYSKSFKNRKRREKAEEDWMIFENVHEPIIGRETWEMVKRIRDNVKRRQPKTKPRNMFSGILRCSECNNKLHYNFNQKNTQIEYFNCSNYRSNRGTCETTHYIRIDALTEVVKLELNRMIYFIKHKEPEFAELLEEKMSKDAKESKIKNQRELFELKTRDKELDVLFEKIYEDNVSGKLSDERFAKLSRKYDDEQAEIKTKMEVLREKIANSEHYKKNSSKFLSAVRKYTRIKNLTPTILNELIEKIVVHHAQGLGKNRIQQIVIYYNFIGNLDLPELEKFPENVVADTRQGVAVEYLVKSAV